jgi:hypothetical protein
MIDKMSVSLFETPRRVYALKLLDHKESKCHVTIYSSNSNILILRLPNVVNNVLQPLLNINVNANPVATLSKSQFIYKSAYNNSLKLCMNHWA